MIAVLAILAIQVAVLAAVWLPLSGAHRRWAAWVGRLDSFAHPYPFERRFGLRSWVSRCFVLTSPPSAVKERINALTEISAAEAVRRDESGLVGLAPMLGKQNLPTGIEVEWLDDETAELRAGPYADWPSSFEDRASLPLKQRQMLANRAAIHVRAGGENCSLIAYELESPLWLYVLALAIVLAIGWTTGVVLAWGAVPGRGLLSDPWFKTELVVYSAALLYAAMRIVPVLRLQSTSLLDNMISGLGELC